MDLQRTTNTALGSPSRTEPPIGRRVVLLGLGSLAVAGITAGCSTGGGSAPTQVARNPSDTPVEPTATAGPSTASASARSTTQNPVAPTTPALPPSVTTARLPTVTIPIPPTSTPVALPSFSSRAITADMTDANQWNTVVIESSGRTLANNAYAVRVTKWPDGRGLFSWGDWVPKNVMLAPQFAAEVEMQLAGDALAASGIIFLFN